MNRRETNRDKELYRKLRALPAKHLWKAEVARFDQSTARERLQRVAVIRAVGAAFAGAGTAQQKDEVREWLRGLLRDPQEKIRRYAMGALPKIGAGPAGEADLLHLLRTTTSEREKKYLGQALEKIGGGASLRAIERETPDLLPQTGRKLKATVARQQSPGSVKLGVVLSDCAGLRVHLRGRRGLERVIRDEVEEFIRSRGKFQVAEVRDGLVAITVNDRFSLKEIYTLRCFGHAGLVPGTAFGTDDANGIEDLASIIASPFSRRLLTALTEGSTRYRLEFVGKGHQRGMVRRVADRVYALCPGLLNDARNAPWSIVIHPREQGGYVELRPKLTPDPRFTYRRADVPAASHPPLAACLARLAGMMSDEIVWDPFCGSGLELIERALLGGVREIHGTDRSAQAIAIARQNFAAAKLKSVRSELTCGDFREFAASAGPDAFTLIITNPPLGKRVPVHNLRGLIADLFAVAAKALQPGGRLVFANPLPLESPDASLQLRFRQPVDFGGFECRLEVYRKAAAG